MAMMHRGSVIALGALALLALAAVIPAVAQEGGGGQRGRTLPAGEGRDLVAVACSQCHALNVIMSVREGPSGWRRHVTNMVTRGAQLSPREADTAIAYLTASFGPGAPPSSGASITLAPGPGKELVEERCTLCHDLERVAVVKRPKAHWPDLVADMIGRGAAASPQEAQTIASYLAANFGN